jgi:hypothetical protein
MFVLAYNLGNFLRRFALPKEVCHWSLTSIQLKLVKIGAKIRELRQERGASIMCKSHKLTPL